MVLRNADIDADVDQANATIEVAGRFIGVSSDFNPHDSTFSHSLHIDGKQVQSPVQLPPPPKPAGVDRFTASYINWALRTGAPLLLSILSRDSGADARPGGFFVVRQDVNEQAFFHRSLTTELDDGLPAKLRTSSFPAEIARAIAGHLSRTPSHQSISIEVTVARGKVNEIRCSVDGKRHREMESSVGALAWPTSHAYAFQLALFSA